MRRTVLALIVLLAVPATADASRKLWLKQARTVTAKNIRLNLRAAGDYYPDHVTATKPTCRRVSRREAACRYTITYQEWDGGTYSSRHYFPATCGQRVRVVLTKAGRPIGRQASTRCYPKPPEDDYEV